MATPSVTFETPWATRFGQTLGAIDTGLNVPANLRMAEQGVRRGLFGAGQVFGDWLSSFRSGVKAVPSAPVAPPNAPLPTPPAGTPAATANGVSQRALDTFASTYAPRPGGGSTFQPKTAALDQSILNSGGTMQSNGNIINYAPPTGTFNPSNITVARDTNTELRNARLGAENTQNGPAWQQMRFTGPFR